MPRSILEREMTWNPALNASKPGDPAMGSEDPAAPARRLEELWAMARRSLEHMLAQHGSSVSQARILDAIGRHDAIRSVDLASVLGLAPRTITEAIDGLERAGLVTRTPDRTDRRAKTLMLTLRGKAVSIATDRTRQAFEHSLFDCLDDEEKLRFEMYVDRIATHLERLEKPCVTT